MSHSELQSKLLKCNNVLKISGHHKPNLLKIECNNGIYALWKHHSKDFNQWYWAAQKCRLLSIDPPTLIHAFLGRDINDSYIIPHEIVAGPTIETEFVKKSDNDYWRLSAKNQKKELDKHSSICKYLK